MADEQVLEAEYYVDSTALRTPAIRELRLRPAEESVIDYRPGQYVLINDVDYLIAPRSYSIANAPRADNKISLLVTHVQAGRTSPWVHGLRPGQAVTLAGPFGDFTHPARGAIPRLYLAAGSGMAPVRALAEADYKNDQLRDVTLIVSARDAANVIDDDVFTAWARQQPGFTYMCTLTRADGPPPIGRLPAQLLKLAPRLGRSQVFVAGPPGFVRACAQHARRAGVDTDNIHTEEFYTDE